MKCYPAKESICITETKAQVTFQALLDKTAERLIESQEECLQEMFHRLSTSNRIIEANLISKWGFDSATAQSTYTQRFHHEIPDTYCKDSLMSTTLTPLNLNVGTTLLWRNKVPSSTRYCRPIKLEYIKETDSVSQAEFKRCEDEIKALHSTDVKITINKGSDQEKEIIIQIKHSLYSTVVDGKVINAVMENPSSQTCYICGATPVRMNIGLLWSMTEAL